MKARVPYKMSKSEKKAMNDEIKKQLVAYDKQFSIDHDATILWTLHVCFGFGAKRLRRYWDACLTEHQRLRDFYEMSPEDDGWLYRHKLKDIGVDVEEWYKEEGK